MIVLLVAGAAYKQFGDRAVAWYMIRFNHGGEDSSSVRSTFRRGGSKINGTIGNSKTSRYTKLKISSSTKNTIKAPLISNEDDDDIGTNDNIALRNNIYSKL